LILLTKTSTDCKKLQVSLWDCSSCSTAPQTVELQHESC